MVIAFTINIDQETVSCNICSSCNYFILFQSDDIRYRLKGEFNVVKCKECGLIYVNPRPKINKMPDYYPSRYDPYQREEIPYKNRIFYLASKYILFFYRYIFENHTNNIVPPKNGKLLDIGCGNGAYLEERASEGWDVWGTDISYAAVEKARGIGLNVFCGSLEDLKFPDEFFDMVTMNHSLEHIHDPASCIREVNRILKHDGILIITLPNIESLEARLFRQHWDGLDIPRHLYHFSSRTISLLVNKNGKFGNIKTKFSPTSALFCNSINNLTKKRFEMILKKPLILIVTFPITFVLSRLQLGAVISIYAKKL